MAGPAMFERLREVNRGLSETGDGWRIEYNSLTVAGKASRRPFAIYGMGVRFPGSYADMANALEAITKHRETRK